MCKIKLKLPNFQSNLEGKKYHPCKRPSSVIGSVSATISFVPVTHAAVCTHSKCVNE